MDVGIGLPNAVPGTQGHQLVEFARRAEAAGFSTLGTLDRIVYPSYDPFVALAAAAAVTERIRLTTAILIVPYRENAAIVAKQAASLHALSGGRLELGVAIGSRDDDYEAAGVPTAGRGRRLEEMLDEMREIWSGERGTGYAGTVGPPLDAPPPVLVGGNVSASFQRAARYGIGWIGGGATPDQIAEARAATEQTFAAAGREGVPKISTLVYFGLGDRVDATRDYLRHYYGWLGDYAEQIAQSAATDEATVKGYLQAYEQAGCDELILFAGSPDPEQVDLLARAALS